MSSRDSGRRGRGSWCQQVGVVVRLWLLEKRRRRGLGEREEAEPEAEETLWRRVAGVLGGAGGGGG